MDSRVSLSKYSGTVALTSKRDYCLLNRRPHFFNNGFTNLYKIKSKNRFFFKIFLASSTGTHFFICNARAMYVQSVCGLTQQVHIGCGTILDRAVRPTSCHMVLISIRLTTNTKLSRRQGTLPQIIKQPNLLETVKCYGDEPKKHARGFNKEARQKVILRHSHQPALSFMLPACEVTIILPCKGQNFS